MTSTPPNDPLKVDPSIKPIAIQEEMRRSYLDYAMSVIVARALPDVRDGLKPVHRRILYAMHEDGNHYNRAYKKSAKVVGNVMGNYHPHGDAPIYQALVRLTQSFNLRVTLVDGQGNFGSIDGDPPAASRYTEARLAKVAHGLLQDIDKDTVEFEPTYDNTTVQPTVLPARFPNLLVNGAEGIAVGMATSIPPHNLGEVIDALIALLDFPDLPLIDIMRHIPGPDFPTGGTILGRHGILEGYRTGRGSISVRGVHHIEKFKNDREAIVITEIPYQVNKARMIEKIADLVRDKTVEGISDLREESDRDGMRVVIELKKDVQADVVVNQLYRYSPLQSSFNFNMLALHQGRPEQLPLLSMLKAFLEFRREVILRRTRYELNEARQKAHITVGFLVAVLNIDRVIVLIRSANDRTEAKERLLNQEWESGDIIPFLRLIGDEYEEALYKFSEKQVDAILELRLHRLTGLEREKVKIDLDALALAIEDYLNILRSEERIIDTLKTEFLEIKAQFSTPRRTQIEEGDLNIDIEDLIQSEDMVVTVSHEGYIKRVPLSTYRAQKRGGRGRSGMTTKEEDGVSDIFVANTHDNLLFFSSLGRVYQLKVYKLPVGTPQSKGRAMVNLFPVAQNETISTVLVLASKGHDGFLMFCTSFGNVRRSRLDDFSYIPSNGKKAIGLDEGESLIGVVLVKEEDDVLLSTKKGLCNRFPVNNVRVFSGRESNGVRGIKLQKDDDVISIAVLTQGKLDSLERQAYLKKATQKRFLENKERGNALDGDANEDADADEQKYEDKESEEEEITQEDEGQEEPKITITEERFKELSSKEQFILTVTEKGYGKRTSSYDYRTTLRGSQGFANIQIHEKKGGEVVASFPVTESDDIMLVSNEGQVIRCPVRHIRIAGRRTQGVIIFRVNSKERVVAVSRIPECDVKEDSDDAEELHVI